ncbi:YraN family protein [Paenibacillus chartarius]|uniref:UPF0102 protein ACFFK0_17965 n=1 Tax=Paenibacillus chartarius TaxID=747481 RepID=A0ABV6DNU7_9BACL
MTGKPSAYARRQQTGKTGEEAAARLLLGKGYKIVARNWRCRKGELDIIAEDRETLVFIEVRTRRATGTFGTAKESVNIRKQMQVRETAQFYLYVTKQFDRNLRFDVVAVELPVGGDIQSGAVTLEHIENAF